MDLVKSLKVKSINQLNKINGKKIAVYFIIALLVLFLLITFIISQFSITQFEATLSRELQEERSPILDFIMKTVSLFGENQIAIPMIIGVALIWLLAKYYKEALFIILSSLASVINFGLKLLINRQRPTGDLVDTLVQAKHQSFPSGHTVHYVVFFGIILVFVARLKSVNNWIRILVIPICLALILAVPFSRVYLGAHWASDVLAGFIEGLILLAILLYFYFKLDWGKKESKPGQNATSG
ncbi:MAG: phosphatase PAP2 family protein [Candidatus Cyclobacteriaceae bacterium M3_2C_046]